MTIGIRNFGFWGINYFRETGTTWELSEVIQSLLSHIVVNDGLGGGVDNRDQYDGGDGTSYLDLA